MLDAQGQVALVDIVGADPVPDQVVDQIPHDMGTVVDATEQNGLVPQGDAGVCQLAAGFLGFGSYFFRMIEMHVQPDRMVLFQHMTRSSVIR